jgi:hypothetical protein
MSYRPLNFGKNGKKQHKKLKGFNRIRTCFNEWEKPSLRPLGHIGLYMNILVYKDLRAQKEIAFI